MVVFRRTSFSSLLSTLCGLFLFTTGVSFLQAQSEGPWVQGVVLETDTERFAIQVDHEAVSDGPGQGPTWFRVSSNVVPHIETGSQIQGRVIRSGGQWRLENISPYNVRYERALQLADTMLQRDTMMRGRRTEREVGERIPAFALLNQQGDLVQSTDLQGKYVIMNFIFTRCAMPDMCPAATARMVRLQNEARSGGIENLQLYSVSFDPEYDTPYVLRDYGLTRGADLSNYHFLTGPKNIVDNLIKQFGITTRDSKGTIDHTMSTVLIAPDGTILYKVGGSSWSVLDFLTHIQDHQSKS